MINWKKVKALLFASLLLAIHPSQGLAQEKKILAIGYEKILGLANFVRVHLSDQAKDNCWTNPKKIEANAKLAFEREGIEVIDYEVAYSNIQTPVVYITVNGFRTGALCSGSASIKVENALLERRSVSAINTEFLLYGDVTTFERGALFTNGSNLNDQLDDFFEGSISELLLNIIKARRDDAVQMLLTNQPSISNRPRPKDE